MEVLSRSLGCSWTLLVGSPSVRKDMAWAWRVSYFHIYIYIKNTHLIYNITYIYIYMYVCIFLFILYMWYIISAWEHHIPRWPRVFLFLRVCQWIWITSPNPCQNGVHSLESISWDKMLAVLDETPRTDRRHFWHKRMWGSRNFLIMLPSGELT